jgi:hypothetical protein
VENKASPGPVGTATCEGGFDGLFDMSGNITEWQNLCSNTVGADDTCNLSTMPFDYSTDPAGYRCDYNVYTTRNTTAASTGIRCCSDFE